MLIPPFSTYPLFKLCKCILKRNGVNSYTWTFQTTAHRRTQQRCLTTSACGSQRRPPFQGPWATAYLQQSTTLQAFGVSHCHTQQQAHSTHKGGYQHSKDITWSQQQWSYSNSHLASKSPPTNIPACQLRVTVGDSGVCCCVSEMSFEC